jgi:hypothetical protein
LEEAEESSLVSIASLSIFEVADVVEDLAVEAAVSMVLEAGEPSVSTEDTCFVAVVVVSFGAPVEYFDCSWDVEPESVLFCQVLK